jgi:hypothetical protein
LKSILLLLVLLPLFLFSQITRYPYIQSPTETSVIIAWKTNSGVIGIVKYGIDSNSLNFTKTDVSTTTQHGLLLDNLQENTKYYYEVYSGLTLETAEFFFTAKDTSNKEFSFIQYGDCGYNNTIQHQIGDLMEADSAEFAVVCGDIDQGGVPHISESEGGDNYDDIYFDVYNDGVNSKMLSQECHFTAIGNHDYYANNGAEYDNTFYLPHNNNENSERYYSFTWGDAKFIALDVITPFDNTVFPLNFANINDRWWTDFRTGSPQYEFLENELKCNDKKWVFVFFHEGPWTNYWGADYYLPNNLGGDYYQFDGNVMVRNHLVPLFEQYNVDFVLNGHSHLFERGEQNGVTYITSGSAGQEDPQDGTEVKTPHWPQLPLSILDNVYAKFHVDEDKVFLEVINDENNLVDTLTKTKSYTEFNINPSLVAVTCFEGNDGQASLNVVGPKGPYSIEWFSGDTTFAIDSLSAGTYFAYVRNVYDCERVVSVTIDEQPLLIPQIVSASGSGLFCQRDSIVLNTTNSYSNYEWSNNDTNELVYLYNEQTIEVVVTDSLGCMGTSAPFSVSYMASPIASFNTANIGNTYNFLAGTTNVTSYSWDFDDGSDTTLSNSLVGHVFVNDGLYTVSLYATNGCEVDTFIKEIQIGELVIIDTTGIYAYQDKEVLNVYPNPFSDKTFVETNNLKGVLTVSLVGINGKRFKTFKTRKKNFILIRNTLAKGYYLLRIEDGQHKVAVSKILIN